MLFIKQVVLKDFEGRKKVIGEFISFTMFRQYNSVLCSLNGLIEQYVIVPNEDIGNVNINSYSCDYGNELVIYTDFKKSKLDEDNDNNVKVIVPLFDMYIVRRGLSEGVNYIKNKVASYEKLLNSLRTELYKRDILLNQYTVELGKERLSFLSTLKNQVKELLDTTEDEFLTAPEFLMSRMEQKKLEYCSNYKIPPSRLSLERVKNVDFEVFGDDLSNFKNVDVNKKEEKNNENST